MSEQPPASSIALGFFMIVLSYGGGIWLTASLLDSADVTDINLPWRTAFFIGFIITVMKTVDRAAFK